MACLDTGPDTPVVCGNSHTVHRNPPARLNNLEGDPFQAGQEVLRQALAQMNEAVLILDKDLRTTYANDAFCRQMGVAAEDLFGRSIVDLGPLPLSEMPCDPVSFDAWIREQGSVRGEMTIPTRDGVSFPALMTINPILDKEGQTLAYVQTHLDLRQSKQAETRLRESEETFRAIGMAAQDAVLMVDDAGRIVFWNDAAHGIFGYSAQEALGRDVHLLLGPNRYHDAFNKAWARFAIDGQGPLIGKVLEFECLRKDGSEFPTEVSVSSIQIRGRWHAVGILRDVTERKRIEKSLQRSNRALRTLSACNTALVHATQERQLLDDMCRTVVRHGDYRGAWIGFAEHDDGETVRQVTSAGFDADDSKLPPAICSNGECGPALASRAIRSGRFQVAKNVFTESDCVSCHKHALEYGYLSCLSLPLKTDEGKAFGVLNICATEADAFDKDEIDLLSELADDLAFGILNLRVRKQRNHLQQENLDTLSRLKEALLGTIRSVAYMVEQRDPYTAGHQARVTDLSCAIARELKLDADRIEGLQLGAMIHDIGKISIPTDILNRPGSLSTPEFEIIKSHPQAGYDIIKDTDFPWPVAQMVLQHHERLDGSGYPQGLKDEAICLEARILSVADIVDAVSAHRPYRPSRGVEKALNVIEADRGKGLDAEVVDACLRLFREKGYALGDKEKEQALQEKGPEISAAG